MIHSLRYSICLVLLLSVCRLHAQCNASNTPTFIASASIASMSTNGICGTLVQAFNANTFPPGGVIQYSIAGPGFSGPVGSTVVTIPGVYTITIKDLNNNCTASATVNASVYTAPQLTVAVSSPTICRSDLVTCSVTGASSYSWSNGITTSTFSQRPSNTITYSVIGTNSAGCASTASVNVTVKPLPTILYSVTNDPICVNGTLSFTATGVDTYTWNSVPGGSVYTTPPFTTLGTYPFPYTLAGTGSNGCVASYTSAITVTVSSCTGVEQKEPSVQSISLFPNPVNTVLEVTWTSYEQPLSIQIVSSTGQYLPLQSEQVALGHYRINTTDLPAGYYFIRIETASGFRYQSFVK